MGNKNEILWSFDGDNYNSMFRLQQIIQVMHIRQT